jgi:acetyl esterase/lipase
LTIPPETITKAADTLISQLAVRGVSQVGGSNWWQWRRKDSELRAEWIEMRSDYTERKRNGGKGRRVMLYVHGGAYFFGSVDEHRYQMQRHARKLRARVFAPRYRLAPQFPFPCGLHDCLAAYLYLLNVQEPEEIILAGDSAGGGMIVSMLVILRDQGLPLPAGAVLISPWVDLTHSFPSVAGISDLDYIPAHGFMHKPSDSWPPPNDDESQQHTEGRPAAARQPAKSKSKEQENSGADAVRGLAVQHKTEDEATVSKTLAEGSAGSGLSDSTAPGAGDSLSIEIDGKLVILKDQMQLYATNQLISHPLVSPILQPSLGGLPPLLILTGGGEVLRDEQVYLAHKAANPKKYPLGGVYQAEYDPNHEILHKHNPTDVQLQVWEDLCHVPPTLSFTRPAKYMYRSIAQFGAWALARAQHRSIEIMDDDDISIISSGSDTDSSPSTNVMKPPVEKATPAAEVGKAGDPLPKFKNHMIRQRVDRHGVIYPMDSESDIAALQMPASDIGVIKPGPVGKWLAARKEWDTKFASEKRRVQKRRFTEVIKGGIESFGDGERPPPSALAGRRGNSVVYQEVNKRRKKSWGMMLWSLWGSKHDESTIKREEELVDEEQGTTMQKTDGTIAVGGVDATDSGLKGSRRRTTSTGSLSRTRRKSRTKSVGSDVKVDLSKIRSRGRTVTVSDQGQTTTESLEELRRDHQAAQQGNTDRRRAETTSSGDEPFLSPTYVPKNKTLDPLTQGRDRTTDAASISTACGGFDHESLSNASTTAVFSASGVVKPQNRKETNASIFSRPAAGTPVDDNNHEEAGSNEKEAAERNMTT